MLLSYTFRNYQSFRDETHVSLELPKRGAPGGWARLTGAGTAVSTVLAVFGANAAGKTALLKPLAFAEYFANDSFQSEPNKRIALTRHFASGDEPFHIDLVSEGADGIRWRYSLTVSDDTVIHEALYKKKKRTSYVFIRDWDPEEEAYVIRQNGFGLAQKEAEKVRRNASLISTASQYGVDTKFADWISGTNINVAGKARFSHSDITIATKFYTDPKLKSLTDDMLSWLRKFDLGLQDLEFLELPAVEGEEAAGTRHAVFGVHEANGKSYRLPLELESSGTQAAYVVLLKVLLALKRGGIALIDELESDLHPELVIQILNLFNSTEINRYGAQLIFTCHSQNVLDLLHRSQVYFVEKEDCSSQAYRGDEIQGLRADDNLRVKYATGALGALPRV